MTSFTEAPFLSYANNVKGIEIDEYMVHLIYSSNCEGATRAGQILKL
jgi:hypothetical protein